MTREMTGWPLVENDLPPAPDPNYCVELEAA